MTHLTEQDTLIERATTAASLPTWVVCPSCRGDLEDTTTGARCCACGRTYHRENGFLNLLANPEDRFEDERQEERDLLEENANTYSTLNYCLPLLTGLFGDPRRASDAQTRPRILSNGCGVAVDVDLFNDHGFDAYGVDCGERTWIWARRRYSEQLYTANAKALPFADDSFDFVTTGCLLPHVGVVGDSTRVMPDFWEQRRQVVREMVRVVRPGGYILMANPNRLCPLDLWHLHDNPDGLVRFHSPNEPFLLSLADYRKLFAQECECRSIQALPIEGYWGFLQKSQDTWRKFLVFPVRWYFRLFSAQPLARLRSTALNPWLIVLVQV